MVHSTVWCEVCEKWVAKGHSGKHPETNYLSPHEKTIGKFWTTD